MTNTIMKRQIHATAARPSPSLPFVRTRQAERSSDASAPPRRKTRGYGRTPNATSATESRPSRYMHHIVPTGVASSNGNPPWSIGHREVPVKRISAREQGGYLSTSTVTVEPKPASAAFARIRMYSSLWLRASCAIRSARICAIFAFFAARASAALF